MVRFLNRLFNIRTHEWPRFLFLYTMLFVVVIGLTWGATILEAAFLQELGVEALPWFFMAKALISVPAVAVYTAFADRVSNAKLLIAILVVSVLGVGAGLGLLNGGLTKLAYPLLYLIIFVPCDDILFAHWYTYVNGFYDTRSAKRVVPVLVTAVGVGGIVGGLSMPLLNQLLSPAHVILVWLGTLIVMAFLTWLMPYLFEDDRAADRAAVSAERERASQLDNVREGYRYVSQSSFLRWLALSTALLMLLLTFLEYRTGQVLLAELETLENISNFIGRLSGITYLIMLPIQLFLLSRIIGRVGLGGANLIYPVGNLAICGSLIFAPRLSTAALAYFGRTNFYGIIGYTVESLLYNAVPLRVKGRARAFISGLILPIGALVGGLLLLSPLVSVAWFVPAFIGMVALAFAITALVVRRQYAKALISMLEQEDFSFLMSQEASALSVADPATLAQLQKKLEESSSHELTVFMAKLISEIGGRQAVPVLGQAARSVEDPRSRAAIVDILVAADVRGNEVRQLYTEFLSDSDGRVRRSAIDGLEELAGPGDKQFRSRMLEMTRDPDTDVSVQALLALIRSDDFYEFTPAVQVLAELLADEDPSRRARGVRVLGRVGDERATRRLVEYLADPADEVRLEAAVAVESLSEPPMPNQIRALVVEKIVPLLRDPVERVRQAALVVLGHLGTSDTYQLLIDALLDPSSHVRATAVEALVQAGGAVIPILQPMLASSDPQLRKMAAVTLSRVSPGEFGVLIAGSYITENLAAIYRDYGSAEALTPCCAAYPSVDVLQSALRERSDQRLDEIFYLLEAVHDPGSVKVVSESLRSEDARVRANAVEALESLTTPLIAGLVAPLFEPEEPADRLLAIGEDIWGLEHPDTAEAVRQLVTRPDDPWLRAITAFALGEMGVALAPKEGRPTDDSAARKPGVGLLDALAEKLADEDSVGEEEEKGERETRRTPPADLFGVLIDDEPEETAPEVLEEEVETPSPTVLPLALSEIEEVLEVSLKDPEDEVRSAAQAAKRMMAGFRMTGLSREEEILLSSVEKIIFLKEVPFFEGMTVDQLKVLANVCEEEFFEEDTRIYDKGDPGGVLYVVVNGRVGIEQEKRTGSFARLADIEAHSYFGEMNLFDNSPRTTSAVAIQDTLVLRLRREPLIALSRQHPDLSLELINVLSQRLREANDRVAELTRTRPRELHKLFDQYA
jgi:HEAT repeat protein